jgi:molybdate transport system substrate-binding protein
VTRKARRTVLRIASILIAFALLMAADPISGEVLRVYAAASLSNALQEVGDEFERGSEVELRLSFASSSTLARQIEQGAPAGIYISANPVWMNYLQKSQLIVDSTRVNLLGNSLVIVAPAEEVMAVDIKERLDFEGRLALADPDHVPAGMYAKQALVWFGWWKEMELRLAVGSDVRAALVYVERGACQLGIVYRSDARASRRVKIVAVIPKESHDPIVYPAATMNGAVRSAQLFLRYLRETTSMDVFRSHGFVELGQK